ncbi:Plant self-incompatibility S1 [Arabidopsis suecica]|uniref:S-protein homolog n=1 Tax=Arabidopsis suecica TaxID=45249 RepID=A0A8T2FJ09_ARASU|nr:Plant self-incompatibility S1 [Arabidopsis suecica]
MTFNNKSHFLMLFMIFSTLIFFVSALDFPNAPPESPSSGADGFLPLAKKHVVIRNVVKNREILNVHCRSSEDDFGLKHISWNGAWGFRFYVNFFKTTKFRCHFTWHNGGSHYFYIFKASRDDSPVGELPICKECIWEVGQDDVTPICRISREKKNNPYCFEWEDGA